MTEAALLAALAERPDDEATWLVYADWLEEQGAKRHAFARLLVELARGVPDEKRLAPMRKAHKQLSRTLDPAWRDEMIRLRAALPLRFRIESVSYGGQTPAVEMFDWAKTFVFGTLERGTLRGRMALRVPFPDRVEIMPLRHVFDRHKEFESLSAGEVPISLGLMWPGHYRGILAGGVIEEA